jgi:hypothetical protein
MLKKVLLSLAVIFSLFFLREKSMTASTATLLRKLGITPLPFPSELKQFPDRLSLNWKLAF